MTPTPEENTMVSNKTMPLPLKRPKPGEEIVISGISGIFPSSDSVQEFEKNLYNKVDMVTSNHDRWVFNHPEMPKHLGQVSGMSKFDAQFFRVHYKQACTMEPMSRKLLEHAYSAIYDSGINPLQLHGKKVGVFIGSTFSESELIVIYQNIQRNGFGITGSNRAMYANRISYWIDSKGPSYSLDVACSSSMACLEHAYRSINSGQCEAAIVGGCNLCMHPNVSLHCRRAGFACLDGKTKCFDKNGDGYVRSDAINVLFLQKAKDAKRIYSEVYHAKLNYSRASEDLLPVREPKELQEFLEAFYSEINISASDVEYVEANGAALPKADTNELIAIGEVFATDKPVKVGCVKSNMGSSEPASGVCGVTKICLAYHNGKLPGNLHYSEPLDLQKIHEDKIQVLTDNVEFGRGFAALNSFSYSGANIHVLMKGHHKEKDIERYKSNIPYLVLVSGRQDDCVIKILDDLKNNPIDPEQIGLLHNIHKFDIPGHMSRGYSILDKTEVNKTVCVTQSVKYCSGDTSPVWFMYSGMGSQWATMGAELLRIPIFAAAIEKCHNVLTPKGIDIIRILTNPDGTIYDNILHSFVGIAAVQIGLTDILREIGIVPDNIIGHSVGELGCAYADGCFTAEEMILSAYSRGLVSVETPFIRGSMAAIGLGYKDILPLCPSGIEVACHNSSESSTISGPADIMKQFVSELTDQGIFAKEVSCSNIAYHSRYISKAGPALLKCLKKVIKNPKQRSEKWVSTSVPHDKWDEDFARYSSAEYHTNNLLNPVLFEETSKRIPANALVIEIAPHGLLQAILKRSLPECDHIPLTRRGTDDPVKFLLEAIGKIYQKNLNVKIDALYPTIEYPVSTGTPLLSHFVKWEHSEDWPESKTHNKNREVTTIRNFVMSMYDDEYKFFIGYCRDGKCIFPEAGFLILTWETLAMYKGVNYKEMSVVFENVQFHDEVIIKPEFPVRLQIMIFKGSNKFEITYEDSTVVSGFLAEFKSSKGLNSEIQQVEENSDQDFLSSTDIYTIMRLKGYSYKYEFESIHSLTSNCNKATVKWTDNWITHLDSLIQFNSFSRNVNGTSAPSLIKKLRIDVQRHKEANKIEFDNLTCINAELSRIYDRTRCGGVQIDGLIFKDNIINVEQQPDVLVRQCFMPHFSTGTVERMETALHVNLQIVSENNMKNSVQIIDFVLEKEKNDVTNLIKDMASKIPSPTLNIKTVKDVDVDSLENIDLIIIDNLFVEEKKMNELYNILPNNSFILAIEQDTTITHSQYKLFSIITEMTVQNKILLLLRKVDGSTEEIITYVPITHDREFSWIPQLQAELDESRKVVLVSERQHCCGLLGMVKKLRKEHKNNVGLMVVDDYNVPSFDPERDIFKKQLEKKLAFNILNKGKWGGYYYLSGQTTKELKNLYLSNSLPGDLDALSWIERTASPISKNLIQVCYAGTSIKDAKIVTRNSSPGEQVFGMDFSGINQRGEKVMGLVAGGSIGSTVVADPDLLWPVPEHWTLEDAATVPLTFAHAYYCLTIRSTLHRKSVILVNGGSEDIGQAIVSICLALDCDVYVTVRDEKQKKILLRMFPDLKEKNVNNSIQLILKEINADMVRRKQHLYRKQCDFVINCLSGSQRKEAIKCVGICGIFLDVADHDMRSNKDFGMHFLSKFTSYTSVRLETLFNPDRAEEKKLIQQTIAEGIAKGIVQPLTRVVYSPANVRNAFRLLSSNKNLSKILIRMKSTEPKDQIINGITRMTYSTNGSYIVVCDGTPLSIELADRLIKHEARNLVIHLTPNVITGYCHTKFLSWNNLNVTLKISSENLQTEKGCANLLKEGAKLGPVRGIFIVHNFNGERDSWVPETFAAKFNNTAGVVANLDLMSRNVCNELDHFVIVNYSSQTISDEYVSSSIDKICQSRNDIGLPALVFRVGQIIELDGTETNQFKVQLQPISTVFNALETSLKLKHNNVTTYNLKKDAASEFNQRISRIIGVTNILELDENLKLSDLILNEVSIDEINTTIKNTYQLSVPSENLLEFTIANLKNLRCDLTKTVSSNNSGFGAFFTYIDRDESLAGEPIVTMATSFSNVTEEEELDPKATYLILVPGFEGHHQIFTTVSERLKVQALTSQLVPDMENDSIAQIAVNIAKFLRKRLVLKSKFYLLGYSFGVNVAIELARLLEKEGHVGVVYCLDSSPDALRAQLDAHIGNLTDSQLQNAIVQHMYKLMTGRDSPELNQELDTKHTWNEKVELCVTKLRGMVNYSHQYKRCLLNSAYRRIMLAREYEPDFTLESELVLIKGIPHPDMKKLPEDFNLSKYTNKPVRVFDIESDHASACQDFRVSNIVNQIFEPKLLDEFKNKNLCWTYLADPIKKW